MRDFRAMRIRTGYWSGSRCSGTPVVRGTDERGWGQSKSAKMLSRENDPKPNVSLWLLPVGMMFFVFSGDGLVRAQQEGAFVRVRPSQKVVGQLRQRLLRRFDENGNGRFDRRESQHAMRTVLGVLAGNRGRVITISKLPAGLRQIFALFDRNRDGVLGPIEQVKLSRTLSYAVRPARGPGGDAGQREGGSVDGDGGAGSQPPRPSSLTPEVLQRLRSLLLTSFDRNRNGRLDPPERSRARRVLLDLLTRHRGEDISIESASPRLGPILGLFDFNGDRSLGPGENRVLRQALLIVLRPRPRPDADGPDGRSRPTRPRPNRPLGEELDDLIPDRPAGGVFEVRPDRPPRPDF